MMHGIMNLKKKNSQALFVMESMTVEEFQSHR